jgi:YYY domain-containing protein
MPLSELFAAFRWWAALLVLGMAATPLAFILFQKLPDRGYAFVKMLGLLLVSYLYWILGSLGFLANNAGSLVVSLAALTGLSLWLYRHQRSKGGEQQSLGNWLRENRSQVILTEFVFAVIFVIWVGVRAQNPAIAATEKPMEFAFLNSVGRSPGFPPLDPWLSGFAISYYYFGYVMTSVIARLALVSEPLAFNLGIAWLIAGSATGAFGLVYNLLSTQSVRHTARVLGLVAALAIPVAGNLEIGLEVAYANGLGSPAFWQWLDVRDLNEARTEGTAPRYGSSNWWWWRSSRPIHEYHISGRPEDGLEPIAEVPAFSFVLGDMHPHVLALPFAFLSLALALVWWLPEIGSVGAGLNAVSGASPAATEDHSAVNELWDSAGWSDRLRQLRRAIGIPLWLLSAIILGGLSFLNTWDVLIYLFVVAGAFLLGRWRDEGWHTRIITQTIAVTLMLLLPIILLYLPFFLGFRSQAGAPYILPMLMRPTRLVQFLIIFAMPLWAILVMLISLAVRQRFRYWQAGLATALLLILALFLLSLFFGLIVAISSEGTARIASLTNELGIALPPRPQQNLAIGWGATAVLSILPTYFRARITYPALTIFLAATVGLVLMIWLNQFRSEKTHKVAFSAKAASKQDALPFALLLVAAGALLTLGPEFVYLRDNFGVRLNTIFKFYYQAWVMFGIAALFAIGYLWQGWRGSRRIAPILATTGYALAFLLALLFPIYAVNSRAMEYRGPATADTRQPATINGLAQVERNNPDEYAAILWLRENVSGTPVILEAVGGQYSGYGRIAASTGLPTILGWAGHEYQWRGNTPEPALREPAVNEIYSAPDLLAVVDLLDRYRVEYIYVGDLEQELYGPSGLDKFAEQLDAAYSNDGVTIYRWQPQ